VKKLGREPFSCPWQFAKNKFARRYLVMSDVKELVRTNSYERQEEGGWTREQIELIKRTVAKDATDDELKLFLYQARKYGLDPLMKEIVFTKFKLKDGTEKESIITTRDGYLKIAQSHPDFQGIISFTVCEGDQFEIDAASYQIKHVFGAKRGKIIGAWARVDRKGYKPFIAYVPFDEYNQNTTTWQKYPSAMIQKVAEAFALKRAFNISGLVTREELGMDEETETNKKETTNVESYMHESVELPASTTMAVNFSEQTKEAEKVVPLPAKEPRTEETQQSAQLSTVIELHNVAVLDDPVIMQSKKGTDYLKVKVLADEGEFEIFTSQREIMEQIEKGFIFSKVTVKKLSSGMLFINSVEE